VKFRETALPGAFLIDLEPIEDERGFFARSWCQREFAEHGLNDKLVQCNLSFNKEKGTLRGMHYQIAPHEEAKLVRCTRGAVYDVIVDLRHESPAFKRWFAVELTADNRTMLYIPFGLAHGFQTLTATAELFYQMTELYDPDCARGVRWNDPAFAIQWPSDERIISPRDLEYTDYVD